MPQITSEWIFGALCVLIYAVYYAGKKIEKAIFDVQVEISCMDKNMRDIFYDRMTGNALENINSSIMDLQSKVENINNKIDPPFRSLP
ncbi:hypothetical protein [Acetobacter cerevisiae]|uniref:Uncharacterized protein n=1 Tax=Acetobacter cerevisiae TaxID=178900 RepID=A0A149Q7S0_9PROT|nr:hypothetical protein [Acetobacter cerevisiae]KXU93302.1 hypothetical protein AD928_08985 [Acetobacter cerevisiae]GBQ10321.1 hypothetical protein AA14362_2514 [Acetobacter cerevisiae DSM 14362]